MTIKEMLDAVEASVLEEERLLFGPLSGETQLPEIKAANGMPLSSKINELIEILRAEPLLLGPTLAFAEQAKARMEFAKLSALYTPEEIEQMRAELAKHVN